MKKRLEKKQSQPIAKPSRITPESNLPHASWTPFMAVVLTGLIGYAAYTLCSHIPIVDYCSAGAWQIFG